jgi:hypothetical protein
MTTTTTTTADPLYGCPPSQVLKDYNSPDTSGVVTLPSGFKGSGLRFHGVIVPSGPFEITKSVFRGPKNKITSGNHALVRAYNKRAGQAVMHQCTFLPQTPSNGLDCILGWQYELYRCDLSRGVDGMGIYASSATGSNLANVIAEDVWIHNLSYFYPDLITPSHADGTHNDCVQIQGGEAIKLTRLKLEGFATNFGTNPDKPWLVNGKWSNGACLIVQNNTGINPKITVNDLEYSGGLSHMNIKTGVILTINGARHHDNVANNASPRYSKYFIRYQKQSATPTTGLSGAVFVDGANKGKKLVDAGGVTSDS